MKNHKYLFWVVSTMLMFLTLFALNGCSLGGETIPKNRTKEQYEFEKTFEPIFKFLEQDKKEFTGLKAYTSRVYIKNQDEVKEYEVDLDITQSDIKGDYTITLGEDNKTVPVTYSNGKLNYGSEVTPSYDEEILNLVVQREFFTSLDVKETFKSAETELREIVYQPENNSDLYKHLKSKYDLPEETTCTVLVNHSSSTIYRVTIQLKSNQKIVQISSVIFEKE
jgi:putative lipoprotein